MLPIKFLQVQSWKNNSAVIIENDVVVNVVPINNLPRRYSGYTTCVHTRTGIY